MRRGILTFALLAVGMARALAAAPTATDLANIGVTALLDRLGAAAPTGAGVPVMQVEAPAGPATAYLPNAVLADFSGKTITDITGGGTTSNHATSVAQNFYGNDGVAPGIGEIDVYNANDWLGADFLRMQTSQAPLAATGKVINASWISNFVDGGGNPLTAPASDALRRIDYVVERDGAVIVGGVNNGVSTSVPQLIGSAYNVIAVGRSDGLSSLGPTTLDVAGRSKPDIVAPATSTSWATAWVSGAAALLLDQGAGQSDAQKPETIKALLLAGASKSPFDLDGNTASTADDWSHTALQPLDLRYGAGQLDVNTSALILEAGQQAASNAAQVDPTGWNHASINASVTQNYFFTVPAGMVAFDWSAIAAWNREIAFTPGIGGNLATLTPDLANIDLRLYQASGLTKGSLIDESVSTIDNVEHIFERGLQAGQYVLSVTSDRSAEYSLAWNTKLVTQGDLNGDGKVSGADYTIWAANFGQSGKKYWEGDVNGDGKVTGADYTIWAANFTSQAAGLPAASVPEPSAGALLALAALITAVGWIARRGLAQRAR